MSENKKSIIFFGQMAEVWQNFCIFAAKFTNNNRKKLSKK